MEDIRYIQRFENFEKSFLLLKEAISIKNPSIVEEAGVIQFFEITFELAWKMMKDYLEFQGFEVKSPRETIKQAFSYGLIEKGDIWLFALKDRNLTVHTYDEDEAEEIYSKIKNEYFELLNNLYLKFKDLSCMD